MNHAQPPWLELGRDVAVEGFFGEVPSTRIPPTHHHILLVEDDALLAMSMAALLETPERIIQSANSARKTFSLLQQRTYDLILLDYRLPDATGLTVMEWLADRQRGESVILISGVDSFDAAIGGLRRGACDYLRKPYHPISYAAPSPTRSPRSS